MSTELLPCPFCDYRHPRLANREDEDGCYWAFIRCDDCGVQTRGKWASSSADTCPIFFGEVRDEWNRRTAAHRQEQEGKSHG